MLVSSMSELPVPSTQRYPTDKLCLYLYLALLLPTLLFSLLRLPPHALDLILHPYDSFGRPCGGSLLPSHPFLFYPSLHNCTMKVCVSKCPELGEPLLSAPDEGILTSTNYNHSGGDGFWGNRKGYYNTQGVKTKIGLFCIPTNPLIHAKIKPFMLEDRRWEVITFFDALSHVLLIASATGCLLALFVQFAPRSVAPLLLTSALGLAALAASIFFPAFKQHAYHSSVTIYVIATTIILVIVVLLYNLIVWPRVLKVEEAGVRFAGYVVCERKGWVLGGVMGFVVVVGLVVGVFGVAGVGVWLEGRRRGEGLTGWGGILGGVLGFVGIWTVCIVKDAGMFGGNSVRYIVSAQGANYYLSSHRLSPLPPPILPLLTSHLGSIISSAFLSLLLFLPKLLLSPLSPSRHQTLSSPNKLLLLLYKLQYFLQTFANLHMNESLTLVHLLGVPYCNASRYAELILKETEAYVGSGSFGNVWRMAGKGIVGAVAVGWGVGYMGWEGIGVGMGVAGGEWGLVGMMAVGFAMGEVGVVHGSLADGVLVAMFLEEYLREGYGELELAPRDLVEEVYVRD